MIEKNKIISNSLHNFKKEIKTEKNKFSINRKKPKIKRINFKI